MERTDTPQLYSIYLNLTNRCNLSCQHCWLGSLPKPLPNDDSDSDEIDSEAIFEAIKDALPLGLKSVKITGGEPFVRKDIFELIGLIHKESIEIIIETNGTLIDPECIDLLRRYDVAQVCISLDGSRPGSHDPLRGVKGGFEKAVNAIRLLTKAGVYVQIITTLYRGNVDELGQLLNLAGELKVGSLSINPLVPSGRGKGMVEAGLSLPLKRLIAIDREIEGNLQKRLPFKVFFSLPLAFKSMAYIRDADLCECNILNILGILGNGAISICGIGYKEKALIFGNILKDGIGGVWKENPFIQSLRAGIPLGLKGVCGRCIFKGLCLGYCRANAYTVKRDILAPYWLCQDAYEKGAFPATRLV